MDPSLHPTDGDPFVVLRSMVTMDAMDYNAVFFEINGDDGDPFVILRSMVTMNPMAFACGHSSLCCILCCIHFMLHFESLHRTQTAKEPPQEEDEPLSKHIQSIVVAKRRTKTHPKRRHQKKSHRIL
eukprot:454979_1